MANSTLRLTDHPYLHAFRTLIPPCLFKRGVACRHQATRDRKLPPHLLLCLLLP